MDLSLQTLPKKTIAPMQIAPRPRYNKAMPISDIILQLPSTIARLFGGWFGQEFWLTRMIFVRALGAIYLVAFLGVLFQMKGLVGSRGLLPAQQFLQQVKAASASGMRILEASHRVLVAHIGSLDDPISRHRRWIISSHHAGLIQRHQLAAGLDHLHVLCSHRASVLWLWLGILITRNRLFGNFFVPHV